MPANTLAISQDCSLPDWLSSCLIEHGATTIGATTIGAATIGAATVEESSTTQPADVENSSDKTVEKATVIAA